jgi:hypothetical protein
VLEVDAGGGDRGGREVDAGRRRRSRRPSWCSRSTPAAAVAAAELVL